MAAVKRAPKKLKRAPNEAPPPTRWAKSKSGLYVEVIYTRRRDALGRKLYALRGLRSFLTGRITYTLDDLQQDGLLRWLKNKPTAAQIRTQR